MPRIWIACGLFLVLAAPCLSQDGAAKQRSDETLSKEILRMMKEVQDARKAMLETPQKASDLMEKATALDRRNTARMKEIVEKHGWPGHSLVGKDAAHAAWLLVQHADRDREFQKRCLKLLEAAVKEKEAAAIDLAYLTDRVRVGENKPQVYGTQFRSVDNKMEPYPIEDAANVDKRRKEVGMSSLAEYRKTLDEVYKPKKKEK